MRILRSARLCFVQPAIFLGIAALTAGCGGSGGHGADGGATGTAELTWTPPTENADETTLTDLAGYRIYYGTSEGIYPNSISLDNPGIASYVVERLAPGTYYFVVTAYDDDGNESTYSNVASKTIH